MNQQKTILVVDDEANFREIISAKLEAAGFKVVGAADGAKSIEAARRNHPDLILMDMKMPVMDGASAVMKLKEDPVLRDIRVVFLTNFGDSRTETAGVDLKFSKEAGAFSYLRKTDDLDAIVDRVKMFVA